MKQLTQQFSVQMQHFHKKIKLNKFCRDQKSTFDNLIFTWSGNYMYTFNSPVMDCTLEILNAIGQNGYFHLSHNKTQSLSPNLNQWTLCLCVWCCASTVYTKQRSLECVAIYESRLISSSCLLAVVLSICKVHTYWHYIGNIAMRRCSKENIDESYPSWGIVSGYLTPHHLLSMQYIGSLWNDASMRIDESSHH